MHGGRFSSIACSELCKQHKYRSQVLFAVKIVEVPLLMNTFSEQILSRVIIWAHFEPIFCDIAWKELE